VYAVDPKNAIKS
jgi:hypothetical protein